MLKNVNVNTCVRSLGESFDYLRDKSDENSVHDMDVNMTMGELSLCSLDQDFLSIDHSIEPLPACQKVAIMSTSYNGSDIFDACTDSSLSLLGSSFCLPVSAHFTASRDDLVVKSGCEHFPSTMHANFTFTQPLTIWSRGRDEPSHPKALEQKSSCVVQPKSKFLNLQVNKAAVPHDQSHAHTLPVNCKKCDKNASLIPVEDVTFSPRFTTTDNTCKSPPPAKRCKATFKRSIRRWSNEEDEKLKEAIRIYKLPNWSLIAKHVGTRNAKLCYQRWRHNLRPEIKSVRKGKWSIDEDERLRQLVSKHKCMNERAWDVVSEGMGFTRNSIQCRDRWLNMLDPRLCHGPWTKEEDALLISLHDANGKTWKNFTLTLTGRSAQAIRRRFYSLTKRNKQSVSQ